MTDEREDAISRSIVGLNRFPSAPTCMITPDLSTFDVRPLQMYLHAARVAVKAQVSIIKQKSICRHTYMPGQRVQ